MSSKLSKVIVFGAHGKVGQQLIKLFSKTNSPYTATAVVRTPEQAQTIESISEGSQNISTIELTLDESSPENIANQISGHDVVVFTAGSRGKNLLQVDLDAAVKTFEASVLAKTRRYIMISALFADNREIFSKSSIRNYYIAKHYADRILINEFSKDLDYTILKPTHLSDGEGTGKLRLIKSEKEEWGTVERADVAKAIYEVIGNEKTYGKSYAFANGDTDVSTIFD